MRTGLKFISTLCTLHALGMLIPGIILPLLAMRNKVIFTLSIILNLLLVTFLGIRYGARMLKESPKFSDHYYAKKSIYESLPKDSAEIILLGNSLIEWGEWENLFDDPNVKNRGIAGDNLPGILNRLDDLLVSKPRKIFIEAGTNDLAWGTLPDSVVQFYSRILAKIKSESPTTKVYCLSILPDSKRLTKPEVIRNVNVEIKKLANTYGYQFIDLYSHFADSNGQLQPAMSIDGLHVNGIGYVKWKSILQPFMQE